MESIEATEAAKAQMMQLQASKASFRHAEQQREHRLDVPTNFSSNFHQLQRELVAKKKAARPPPAEGRDLGPGGGNHGQASDSRAYGTFRANVRNQKR